MNVLLCFVVLLGVLALSTAESCRLDLGLVVDTTKSIGVRNIPKFKAFIKALLKEFTISASETRVSLETFASHSKLRNRFKDEAFYSEAAMFKLIDDSTKKLKSPTRLDRALKTARVKMFTEKSGDRPEIPSVMVIYSDGRSKPNKTQDFQGEIQSLKRRGVRIVAVAIGPDSKKQKYRDVLESIAGENVFYSADYDLPHQAILEIVDLICPPSPCSGNKGLDLAFLIDRTKSLTVPNFKLLKGFVRELSDGFVVGPDATHIAFILFAKQAKVLNTFADSEYYSNEAVHNLLDGIPDDLYSATYIDRALIAADKTLFTSAGGDRPGYPNVLILLTDGKTNKNSKNFTLIIPSLEKKNVKRLAVGVGNFKTFIDQLHEISSPNCTFTASDFVQVTDLFDNILKMACS